MSERITSASRPDWSAETLGGKLRAQGGPSPGEGGGRSDALEPGRSAHMSREIRAIENPGSGNSGAFPLVRG